MSYRKLDNKVFWYYCDFCNKKADAKTTEGVDVYTHMNIKTALHHHYFCNEACFNCFVLKNNCIYEDNKL